MRLLYVFIAFFLISGTSKANLFENVSVDVFKKTLVFTSDFSSYYWVIADANSNTVKNTNFLKPLLLKNKQINSLSIFQKYSPLRLTNLIPDGAIFCKMENHIRNKLNFYVKLRAGYDETYEKVLKQQR